VGNILPFHRGPYLIKVLSAFVVLATSVFAQTSQSTNPKPLTYGLVLDNSSSMRTELPKAKEIAKLTVSSNTSDDETFIVSLVQKGKTALLVDVTTDKSVLLTGVNSLKRELGQTALIDGIYSSADYLLQLKNKLPERRYALVIISDGEDRSSSYKPEKLLGLLKQLNCPLFFVGFLYQLDQTDGFVRESPYVNARKLIEQLTKETGGKAFFVNKGTDSSKLVDLLTKALRN
jgi:VWFA-related protein